MTVLLELRRLRVRSLDCDFNEVTWELEDTSEDVLDYTFQIQRSESGSGPWDALDVPFSDSYRFIDNTIHTGHRWRKYFYQLHVVHVPTGDFKDFGPATKDPDPDLIALELRRHNALLFREFAGRRCWVLPVRTFGQRCFLPGTVLQGAVIGASRAVYKGKAVKLTTKKGLQLSVTANHPVLTSQGLVDAQTVRVGDQLVCYGGKPEVGVGLVRTDGHEEQQPARVEDVFRTFTEQLQTQSTRAVGLDFHGEAQRFVGDVDVVGSYRDLLLHHESSFAQQLRDGVLVAPASSETAAARLGIGQPLLHGVGTASRCGVCGSSLSLSEFSRLTTPSFVRRFGDPAQLHSPLRHCLAETLSRNTALPGELIERGAGLVALDEVVDVRIEDYFGHVFDFETLTGWVVASGIFTSNCSCWNPQLRQATRSGCKTCYGTTYVRGYMHPVESWMQIDPSPKSEQNTNVGAQQQSNTTMRMPWYPPLKPRDLVIEGENRRWRVTSVTQTEKGRAGIHQEVGLHEIPPRDLEFDIPLDLGIPLRDLWLSPSRNFSNPTTLEGFMDEKLPAIFDLYPKKRNS